MSVRVLHVIYTKCFETTGVIILNSAFALNSLTKQQLRYIVYARNFRRCIIHSDSRYIIYFRWHCHKFSSSLTFSLSFS